jgi:hypothetical protein
MCYIIKNCYDNYLRYMTDTIMLQDIGYSYHLIHSIFEYDYINARDKIYTRQELMK